MVCAWIVSETSCISGLHELINLVVTVSRLGTETALRDYYKEKAKMALSRLLLATIDTTSLWDKRDLQDSHNFIVQQWNIIESDRDINQVDASRLYSILQYCDVLYRHLPDDE
jgi:hypothetical protein